MSTGIKHVEMFDGHNFCGGDRHSCEVRHEEWQDDASTLRRADCNVCLQRITALGAASATKLAGLDEGGDVIALRFSESELALMMALIDFHTLAFENLDLSYRKRGDKADMQKVTAGAGLYAVYSRLDAAKRAIAPNAAPAINTAALPPPMEGAAPTPPEPGA